MQNTPEPRLCAYCQMPISANQQFCARCGSRRQTTNNRGLPTWSIVTLVIVGCLLGSCMLCGVFGIIQERLAGTADLSTTNAPTTPSSSPTPYPSPSQSTKASRSSEKSPVTKEIGSEAERLQVAADVRRYLRDQDIPAAVVASGTTLSVLYKFAKAEFTPHQNFLKQQGQSGLRKMANAGFETVSIEAYDQQGQLRKTEISLAEYRK